MINIKQKFTEISGCVPSIKNIIAKQKYIKLTELFFYGSR